MSDRRRPIAIFEKESFQDENHFALICFQLVSDMHSDSDDCISIFGTVAHTCE